MTLIGHIKLLKICKQNGGFDLESNRTECNAHKSRNLNAKSMVSFMKL